MCTGWTTSMFKCSSLTILLVLGLVSLSAPPAPAQSQQKLDNLLDDLKKALYADGPRNLFQEATELAKLKDPHAIPTLIGLIDADNSIDTVYGIGYFALSPLTGVAYDDLHYGPWWRKWWEANKQRYPESVQALQIPDLPKTARGKEFAAKQIDPLTLILEPTLDDLLQRLTRQLQGELPGDMSLTARAIAERKDPRAIPTLIGVIDADNSYDTIYGVGYFGLSKLTGVRYDGTHHGPWWRKWWESRKSGFPPDVQALSIPDLPKTTKGKEFAAQPVDPLTLIVDPTVDDLLQRLAKQVHGDLPGDISNTARTIAEHNDPRAIPTLIGLIDSDNTYDTIYGIGYFALGKLTDVPYNEKHDGAWWRQWWNENSGKYTGVDQTIPQFRKAARKPAAADNEADDVADVPVRDLRIADDADQRYFLIGPTTGQAAPKSGYRLLIVLPGGDGSAGFHPFVKRIFKSALPDGYLVAQAVAPQWSDDTNRIVWPTRKTRDATMKFPTEEFIEAIVADVKKHHQVDARYVFALGWSSGGPPVYATAMQETTSLTGAFVAMSVFHPTALPLPDNARGRAFYLLHSPQDFIKMSFPENARDTLKQAGAAVELKIYEGGHGWHGDVFGNIRAGIRWLEAQQE